MESKDAVIFESLRQNSRKTVKEIARETGIPRTTVFERIRKMEKSGLIKAYTVRPDYDKLELPILAYVFVAYDPSRHVTQKDLAAQIAKLPGVFEVCIVAGEWDIIVKVRGKSLTAIGELVVGKMKEISGVAKTLTFPVFYLIKEEC